MVGVLLKGFLTSIGPLAVLAASFFSMPGPVVEVALPATLNAEDAMLTAQISYSRSNRLPETLLVTIKGEPIEVLHKEWKRITLDNGKAGLQVTLWLHQRKPVQWI